MYRTTPIYARFQHELQRTEMVNKKDFRKIVAKRALSAPDLEAFLPFLKLTYKCKGPFDRQKSLSKANDPSLLPEKICLIRGDGCLRRYQSFNSEPLVIPPSPALSSVPLFDLVS